MTSFALYEAYGTRPYEWSDGVTGDPDRQKANTKEEESDLGLLNEGMRFRDLETGVFLTRDPIGYADGPNVYCYVHCNPITSFDAFGLSKEDVDDAKEDLEEKEEILDDAIDKYHEAVKKEDEAWEKYEKASDAYKKDDSPENKRARDRAKAEYRKAGELTSSAMDTYKEAMGEFSKSVEKFGSEVDKWRAEVFAPTTHRVGITITLECGIAFNFNVGYAWSRENGKTTSSGWVLGDGIGVGLLSASIGGFYERTGAPNVEALEGYSTQAGGSIGNAGLGGGGDWIVGWKDNPDSFWPSEAYQGGEGNIGISGGLPVSAHVVWGPSVALGSNTEGQK